MDYQTMTHQEQEQHACRLRDFIYRITKDDAKSPVSEAEVEEIARCALRGGYKFNTSAFAEAFGRWMLF